LEKIASINNADKELVSRQNIEEQFGAKESVKIDDIEEEE